MTQKAYAEGLRSLVLYTASVQDEVQLAAAEGRTDAKAERLNDLLLPMVKGCGSERILGDAGHRVAADLRRLGLPGGLPAGAVRRGTPRSTLCTKARRPIQGQDLFFRKIVKDQGGALTDLSLQIGTWLVPEGSSVELRALDDDGQLKEERTLLERGLENVGSIVSTMTDTLQSAHPRAPEGDVTQRLQGRPEHHPAADGAGRR